MGNSGETSVLTRPLAIGLALMPPPGGPAPFRSEEREHNGPSPRAEHHVLSREAGGIDRRRPTRS
jgi:hypothetical protein